jgi:hypothetical protein
MKPLHSIISIICLAVTFSISKEITVPEYSIIKERPSKVYSKSNLDIRLENKVDDNTLKMIAYSLRKERMQYDRVFIFYYLHNMTPGHGAWAISHFDPDRVDIQILGSTIEDDAKLSDIPKVAGEIIGEWDNSLLENKISIFSNENKTYIQFAYTDGTLQKQEVRESIQNKKRRFDYTQPLNGERLHFLIESNGNLSLCSQNGKFAEARKL